MRRKHQQNIQAKKRYYQRCWKSITAVLAVLVVFVTVRGLVLPAITMSTEPCQLEEHAHTDACFTVSDGMDLVCTYDTLQVHKHVEACYDEKHTLVCGLADFVVHTHETACFRDGAGICKLPEVKEHRHSEECYKRNIEKGHMHTDECYEWIPGTDPVCGVEASEGHAHGESCYVEDSSLTCGLEESVGHGHNESCYVVEISTVCGMEESAGHMHAEGCYGEDGSLICGMEESAGHMHEEGCYTESSSLVCGMEESAGHIHDVNCYFISQSLICTVSETAGHSHNEDCFTVVRGSLICGKEEKEQTESAPELICGKKEIILHTHKEECYIKEDETNENTEPRILELIKEQKEEAAAKGEKTDKDTEYLICPETVVEEHKHLTDCFAEPEPELTCQLDEHKHVPECGVETGETESEYESETGETESEYESETGETESEYESETGETESEYESETGETESEYESETGETESEYESETGDAESESESESESEDDSSKGSMTFVTDGYTTTVIAPEEANLPEDTCLISRAVFDSDDPMVAQNVSAKARRMAETDYEAEIREEITWGEVTGIKLFDMTLVSEADYSEVQPAVPVQVRTHFTEAISLKDGEVLYGVHFGVNGLEILSVSTERDELGNVIAITHTQSSFSVTGYILVHLTNEKDIGPDVLPVHYCIWSNDQWIIAGSTRTGWYGSYNPRDQWPPANDQRDYITLDQMVSVLGPYGLSVETEEDRANLSRTIWYQRAEDDGKTIRHDTSPAYISVPASGGSTQEKWVFYLSGNKVKDDGYHIYYVPGGTLSGSENDPQTTYDANAALGADLKQESRFYTMVVRDMNHVVYEEGEPLPDIQYVRYNTPVSVTVKANNITDPDTGDVVKRGWQWVNAEGKVVHGITRRYDANGDGVFEESEYDSRFKYQDNGDGTETYSFGSAESRTGILGRTTLIPYSEAVDEAESTTDKQVDIVVHLDGEWQKVGQLNLMYKQDNVCVKDGQPLWFITAGQVYTILKDFGFTDPVGDNDITKDGYTFCHANQLFDENTNPADVVLRADGLTQKFNETIAIGLGTDDADAFTLFYLPGSSSETKENIQGTEGQSVTAKDYADSALIKGDRFYSITVKDDYQLVYYGYETSDFKVNVPEGDPVKVSVQNALSVLWSVREPWAVDKPESYVESKFNLSYDSNFNVYEFESVNGPIQIEASSLNPKFYVQYFANIERYKLYDAEGTGTIPLINTAGGNLPTNSSSLPLKHLQLTTNASDAQGGTLGNTGQNAGNATALHRVETYIDNTEIYQQKEYVFDKSHRWENIDKLYDNNSYLIEALWILKEGKDPLSTDEADWWIYESANNGENITFTNLASEEYAPKDEDNNIQSGEDYTILITEGMVMRLHYSLKEGSYTDPSVKFYDYDISSDGTNVRQQGINSINQSENTENVYGFGNSNCATGVGNARWSGQALNKFNTGIYKGGTYGLVTGVNGSDVTWASGVKAPNIFGGGGAVGRTDYTGSLTFHQRGDVYTLQGFSVAGSSRNDLNYFFNPSPKTSTTHSHIFTNNFWALDGAKNKDGHWGKQGSTGTVNGYRDSSSAANNRGSSVNGATLPVSDDGNAHNWFFGMKFSMSFNVSEDYVGPLEYIFFGDDDMWVFLDGQLICDIGGVHSAVGEYVNIRDYLPVGGAGTAGNHTLQFFYTERGASGSTCWMSFTLPSVTSTTIEEGTTEIVITKELESPDGEPVISDERYEFIVNLYTDSTKAVALNTPFSVQIDRADGSTDYFATSSGSTLRIGANDKVRILGVPIGTWYVIREVIDGRFNVTVNGEEGLVIEAKTDEYNLANFVNTYKGYRLPDTGGSGSFLYLFWGIALMSIAGIVLFVTRRKCIS